MRQILCPAAHDHNAPLAGLGLSLGTRGLFASRLAKLHFGLRLVADHPGAAQRSLEALLRFFRAVLVTLTGFCHEATS